MKLGRETDFVLSEEDPLEVPFGQKLFVLDEERSVSILEIRSLEFDDSRPAAMIYDEGRVCPFATIC